VKSITLKKYFLVSKKWCKEIPLEENLKADLSKVRGNSVVGLFFNINIYKDYLLDNKSNDSSLKIYTRLLKKFDGHFDESQRKAIMNISTLYSRSLFIDPEKSYKIEEAEKLMKEINDYINDECKNNKKVDLGWVASIGSGTPLFLNIELSKKWQAISKTSQCESRPVSYKNVEKALTEKNSCTQY
jgi:hypothetical protein